MAEKDNEKLQTTYKDQEITYDFTPYDPPLIREASIDNGIYKKSTAERKSGLHLSKAICGLMKCRLKAYKQYKGCIQKYEKTSEMNITADMTDQYIDAKRHLEAFKAAMDCLPENELMRKAVWEMGQGASYEEVEDKYNYCAEYIRLKYQEFLYFLATVAYNEDFSEYEEQYDAKEDNFKEELI